MVRFDWIRYVDQQLLWAERLMAVADEAEEDERRELYLNCQAVLLEASRRLGELLAGLRSK